MKIAGALLVWLGCILVSLRACRERRQVLRTMEELVSAVEVLEREMALGRRALPDLLEQLASRHSPLVGQLFLQCRNGLAREGSFHAAWERSLEGCGLDEQLRRTLEPLGWQLGRYDAPGQGKSLERLRMELERQLERRRMETAQQQRVIGAVGVTVGGFLSLTLI